MTALEIEVIPEIQDPIVGGSLPVAVVLRNVSASPLLVHSPDAESPFEYELTSLEDGSTRRLSAERLKLETTPHPSPPMQATMAGLQPGEELELHDDVAAHALDAIVAGAYELKVTYRLKDQLHESPAVALAVRAPRAEWHVQIATADRGRFASALVDRAKDSSVTLYQREGGVRGTMALPRHRAESVEGLAIAADVAQGHDWRWLGWLESGELRGLIGWGRQVMTSAAGFPIKLEAGRLLETGWQHPSGAAQFAILGREGPDYRLAIVDYPKADAPQASFFDLGEDEPLGLVATFLSDDEPSVQAAWHLGKRILIGTFPVGSAAGSPAPPLVLHETRDAPVTLALEPVTLQGVPVIHVLSGPSEDGEMTYSTIAFDGSATSEWSFPVPEFEEGEMRWAITGDSVAPHAVLALAGDRLLWARPGAFDGWQTVDPSVAAGSHLRLTRLDTLWATWVDAEEGVQRARLETP